MASTNITALTSDLVDHHRVIKEHQIKRLHLDQMASINIEVAHVTVERNGRIGMKFMTIWSEESRLIADERIKKQHVELLEFRERDLDLSFYLSRSSPDPHYSIAPIFTFFLASDGVGSSRPEVPGLMRTGDA